MTTENEIIKALECCGNQMYSCTDKSCKAKTLGEALDLINRQKAEIEKLQEVIFKKEDLAQLLHKEHQETVDELQKVKSVLEEIDNDINPLPFVTDFDIAMRKAKSEAIKEFAEKLRTKAHNYYPSIDSYCCSQKCVALKDIDNLVKEMAEGEKE